MTQVCYEITTGDILYTVSDDAIPMESKDRSFAEIADDCLDTISSYKVVSGVVTLVTLDPVRMRAISEVNSLVGYIRRRFITDLPGQEMIYLDKIAEAKAYLADPLPDLANYPAISAEIGITANSSDELVQIWLNMSSMWKNVSGSIEGVRLSATSAINYATSKEEIYLAIVSAKDSLEPFL